MKILSFILIVLLVATTCFAGDVYIRDTNDKVVNPPKIGTAIQSATTYIGQTKVSLGSTSGIIKLILNTNCDNTGYIYIGDSASLTVSKGAYQLASNTVLVLDVSTVDGIYASSTVVNQRLSVMTIR